MKTERTKFFGCYLNSDWETILLDLENYVYIEKTLDYPVPKTPDDWQREYFGKGLIFKKFLQRIIRLKWDNVATLGQIRIKF